MWRTHSPKMLTVKERIEIGIEPGRFSLKLCFLFNKRGNGMCLNAVEMDSEASVCA